MPSPTSKNTSATKGVERRVTRFSPPWNRYTPVLGRRSSVVACSLARVRTWTDHAHCRPSSSSTPRAELNARARSGAVSDGHLRAGRMVERPCRPAASAQCNRHPLSRMPKTRVVDQSLSEGQAHSGRSPVSCLDSSVGGRSKPIIARFFPIRRGHQNPTSRHSGDRRADHDRGGQFVRDATISLNFQASEDGRCSPYEPAECSMRARQPLE